MRRKQRVGTGRPRRGATLVFVAVFAVALVAMAAFAIDVSRLYVGTNELQTGADAAALRGALQLQSNPGTSPVAITTAFAKSNAALNDSIRLANADVTPIFYDPTATPKSVVATWATANAVEVVAEKSTGMLFGRVLTSVSQTPRRKAIAWVANINSVTCPAPWGFPLSALNNVLYGAEDFTLRSDMFARLDTIIDSGKELSIAMILYHSDQTKPTSAPAKSFGFDAIDDNDPGGNNMNEYPKQIARTACAANSTLTTGLVEAFPGKGGGAVPAKTVDGAFGKKAGDPSLCIRKSGAPTNADCYPIASGGIGPAGVTVTVGWIDPVVGKNAQVRTIGGFKVMCVFNGKKGNGKADPDEHCDWYDALKASAYATAGLPVSFEAGTIVGYPMRTYPGLGQGTTLGNTPALGQRLILVR